MFLSYKKVKYLKNLRCHIHYDREAVSQCNDCSKTMCPVCTNKYNNPLCDNCAIERIRANRSLLIKNTIIMVIAFIIGFSGGIDGGLGTMLFGGLLFAGIPWGWSTLNRITPNIFLFMPIIGWLIYFGFKFALAMMIGVLVMPFKIYGIVKGLKEYAELENYAKSVNV